MSTVSDLQAARTEPEILAAVTLAICHKMGREPSPPPTADDLEGLLKLPEVAPYQREAGGELAKILPTKHGETAKLYGDHAPPPWDPERCRWIVLPMGGNPLVAGLCAVFGSHIGMLLPLADVHAAWLELPLEEDDHRPLHPLAPIVRAWLGEVRADDRGDPILPVVTVHESPERAAGRLAFFGGIDPPNQPVESAQLPLLAPELDGLIRVPLLELSDWRGVPSMSKGRGAPLDLRLAVATVVLMPHISRAARGKLAVTVRELRDFLWPKGWERRRDLPRMRAALYRARDYVIPVGGGRLWLPFALRLDPGPDAALDDVILIDVELPPGMADGPPIVSEILRRLSVESGPRFRAYIAAHSVTWKPGITKVKAPQSGGRWLWTSNPEAYPVLTQPDRRRLAFGANDPGNRTKVAIDKPWTKLPGMVVVDRKAVDRDGRGGWRIVPEAVADKVLHNLRLTAGDSDPLNTLTIEKEHANHRKRAR